MNIAKEFGGRLRAFRAARGLTQLELGERLGVTMQYVGQLERGVSTPSFKLLRKICDVLVVAPAALFLFSEGEASSCEDVESLFSRSLAVEKGAWRMELATGTLVLAPKAAAMLGVPAGAAGEAGLAEFLARVLPPDASRVSRAFADLQGGRPMDDVAFRVAGEAGTRLMLMAAEVVEEDARRVAWGSLMDLTSWSRLESALLRSKIELEHGILDRSLKLEESSRRLQAETASRTLMEKNWTLCCRMVAAAMDGIACVDRRYNVLAVNAAWETLAGLPRGKILGGCVDSFINEEEFEEQIRPALDLALAGQDVRRQAWCETRGRGRLALDLAYSPFRGRDGEVEGVMLSARDVTESRLAREALAVSESRLREAQLVAGVGSFYQASTGETYWSDQMFRMLGYQPGEVAPSRELFRRCIHPDDLEEVLRLVEEGAASRKPLDAVFRYLNKAGEVRWARVLAKVERGPLTGAGRLHGTMRDVTGRKRTEEILRRDRERMAALLNSSPHIVGLQTQDYTISYCNDRFRAVFGAPEGRFCYEIFHGESSPCQPCPMHDALSSGRCACWSCKTPGNQVFEVHVLPFTDPDGPGMLLLLGVDVTGRMEREPDAAGVGAPSKS